MSVEVKTEDKPVKKRPVAAATLTALKEAVESTVGMYMQKLTLKVEELINVTNLIAKTVKSVEFWREEAKGFRDGEMDDGTEEEDFE